MMMEFISSLIHLGFNKGLLVDVDHNHDTKISTATIKYEDDTIETVKLKRKEVGSGYILAEETI